MAIPDALKLRRIGCRVKFGNKKFKVLHLTKV